jgi:hypothetical protein
VTECRERYFARDKGRGAERAVEVLANVAEQQERAVAGVDAHQIDPFETAVKVRSLTYLISLSSVSVGTRRVRRRDCARPPTERKSSRSTGPCEARLKKRARRRARDKREDSETFSFRVNRDTKASRFPDTIGA